jgi:hypothetical protein
VLAATLANFGQLGKPGKGNARMTLSLSGLVPRLRPRHAAWAGLLAACGVAVACSSTNNPPADAYMAAEVGGGASCSTLPSPNSAWLPVGTDTAGKPTTVTDQGSTGSGTATIDCTVHPSGNGFDVQLSVSVAGNPGGTVIISGTVTTSGGTGITGSFYNSVDLGPYAEDDCTISFTYLGQPVPISPPIAAGRIWGHIDCPKAVEAGQNNGMGAVTCPASADFLFEQCNQ